MDCILFAFSHFAMFSLMAIPVPENTSRFHTYDYDLAIFNQVSWNTLHGNFMYSSIRESTYERDGVRRRVGLYFKDHSPHSVVLLPDIRNFPVTLDVADVADCISRSSGDTALFYRQKGVSCRLGTEIVLILLYPALGYINLFEFHPTCFVPFFLFTAFYFYRLGKYVLF